MPEPEHTLPFADMVQETAPKVPDVLRRLQWAVDEGAAHDLHPRERQVLWYICWRAGETTGLCMVSRDTMSYETGLGIGWLKKVLPKLEKLGLIRTSRRGQRDHFAYQPTCVRSSVSEPQGFRYGTPGVPIRNPWSSDTEPPLLLTKNSNEKVLTPPRVRARVGRRRRGEELSPEEHDYLRTLEHYEGTHTWNDVHAAARIYARDPTRWIVDRERWDVELSTQGKCAYCGAGGIRPDEWIRNNAEDRFGLCPHCMKERPLEPPQRAPVQSSRSRY